MTDSNDDQIRRRLHRALDTMQPSLEFSARVRARLLHRAATSQGRTSWGWRYQDIRWPFTAAAVAIAVAAALVLVLVAGFGLRTHAPQAVVNSQSLTGGPAAVPQHGAAQSFVWLTGYSINPPAPNQAGQGGSITGVNVDVLDWTGTLRYHFSLPKSINSPGSPRINDILAISGDGMRALLDDGTVLNETGGVVGRIPALGTIGFPFNQPRWASDDSAVCVAASNEPVPAATTLPPKSNAAATPPPLPPYALPGADHSVTLELVSLSGHVRKIATVGSGPLGEPSGANPDSTSVASCNPDANIAVVARAHDATDDSTNDEQTSNDMTISLWAVQLSSGKVLFHQPETRIATGIPWSFGSANGKLAVEFLWNNKVAGSQVDRVLRIPSGTAVPLTSEPIADITGVSADGTRILRRLVDTRTNQTSMELLAASDARIIRNVVLPGITGATAVAEPGGSSFLVDVSGHLALVDGNGGISLLHPDLHLGQPSGVDLPAQPWLQG